MEWGTVSTASMVGMVFSLIISVGLPIVLGIIVYKKTHAKVSSCFIGAGIFVVFALILEQIIHTIVLAINPAFQGHIVLFGLYAALAAGLFEETGRFIAMKFFMKKSLDKGNALMYGVGHGGVERVAAVILQICLSVLVYKCVKTGQKKFVAGAFLLHFPVDFVTVVTAGFGMPVWAVEIEVAVIVVIVAWGVAKIYYRDDLHENE